MRMKSKRLCSLILALSTVFSLVSAAAIPAVAADSTAGSVILDKTVTLENDGTYTINLSGFVTGETTHTKVENAVPLDVVLVLDASSSMLKFANTPDTYETTDPAADWGSDTTPYSSTATSSTNLWNAGMSRKSKYFSYDTQKFEKTDTTTYIRGSVMIPVKPGDRIYCSSFRSKDKTQGAQNGICVAYYRSSGKLLKSVSASDVYKEFTGNDSKYITVPNGAYVMNIPVWQNDSHVIKNLSLGGERYNPVNKLEFEAMRAKVLQQQIQAFADALVENGLKNNVQHKLAIATFGGAGGLGIGNQGKYEKHVGVNGYGDSTFTNTGVFVGQKFVNFEGNPSAYYYEQVFAKDLDTSKTYYYLEPSPSSEDTGGQYRAVTYDAENKVWVNSDGKTMKPQAKPYQYNSYTMFYARSTSTSTEITTKQYKNALADVLVDGKLNPDLQYAIDRYVARGATQTGYGMAIADNILAQNKPREYTDSVTGQKIKSQQIVILFTDGNTHDLDEDANGNPTYQTVFYRGNRIKCKGAKIYTVGVADEEEGDKMAQWMDQLSSNYTKLYTTSSGAPVGHDANAAAIFDSSKPVTENSKYYYSLNEMSKLAEIFTTITTDVSTSESTVQLGTSAVMRDYLANGLKIPEDLDFSDITVYAESVKTTDSVTYTYYNKRAFTNNGDGTYTLGGTTVTVSIDRSAGCVSATGFKYSYHYVAPEHNGNQLIVEIKGVEATSATPTDVLLNTNTSKSGIAYTNADGKEVLYPFEQPKTQLASVNYIMDYAQPLTISADGWGEILGIAGSERLNLNVPTTVANGDIVTQFGTFVNNGNNTYTFNPSTMQWSDSACFYVLRKLANGTGDEDALQVPEGVTTGLNQWVKVNVVPANNIYYENSFGDIHYTGNWVSDGTSQNKSENPEGAAGDADGVHGWEENLNVPMYSDGIAHKGTVSTGVKAEASFTFTGTGVDIYGRTNETTGTVLVTLQGKDKDGNAVSKGQVVDTQSVSGDYYQIPAVSFTDLPYGTYTVTVRVTTAVSGRFTYYLDGVRVYEPLDDDMSYGYAEQNAEFSEIRDLLEKQVADTNTGGAVFVDKAEDGTIGQITNYGQSQYGMYGPKNEVYLAAGQSITFKVDTYDGDAYYYVGLKVPAGKGNTLVKASNGDDTTQEFTIGHSTDMYYHVTPDANGYITIENSGTNLLSVTKVRIAGAAADAQVLTVSDDEVLTALDMFSMRPVNSMITAPEVQTPAITLKSPTLSLEDSIKLNIYFTMDWDVEPAEIGMLTWLQAPDVVDFATADSVFTGCNMDDITGEYYVSTAGIPAQNLGDTIYFCVYARMADGSYVYSKQVQYSPTTYAYNQLEGNADAATKALLVSILNYGAAAQKYLGYKTDALVDRDLSEDMKALVDAYNANMVHAVSAPSAAKQGAMAANGGFKAMKPTIALDGAFAINYYFTPDRDVDGQMTFYYWDAADFEAADVLDMDNATGSCVMTNKNGTFGATIDGIAAKDIDGALYACGVYTDVEGNTYSTGVLPYSVGFYCGNQAQGNDATAALATAIAVYGYYAASYFA